MKKDKHNLKTRSDLAAEAPYGDTGQVICFLIFLPVWIVDSFILKFSTILLKYIPLYITLPIAGILFVAGIYIAYISHHIVFKEIREPPTVIKKSFFKMMRHPLYFATIIFYVSLTVSTLSLVSLILLVGIIVFYDYIAAYEEKKLEQKFGEDYVQYKKQVSKWIPLPFRKKSGL